MAKDFVLELVKGFLDVKVEEKPTEKLEGVKENVRQPPKPMPITERLEESKREVVSYEKIPIHEVVSETSIDEVLEGLFPKCPLETWDDIATDYVDWDYLNGNLYLYANPIETTSELGFLVPIGDIHDVLFRLWQRATLNEGLKEVLEAYKFPRVREVAKPYTYRLTVDSPSDIYIIYEFEYPYLVFYKNCNEIGVSPVVMRAGWELLAGMMEKETIAKIVHDAGIELEPL